MTDASANLQIEVTSQGGLFGFVKSNLDFDILETTAAPTGTFLSDALTSIRNENDDWYAVMLPYGGKQLASQPLLHDLLKDNERIMFFNSLDDEVLKDTAGNIAETLYDANKDRIVAFFHHNVVDMPHCAWAGRVLPENPGSVTWMFKSLSGVTAESFTTAEQGKLDSNNVNRYVKISGLSITRNGTSSKSGFYVDVIRGIDFIKARMQEAIFRQLATLKKIPFTDQGIAVVENEIRAILRLSISQGILSSDPQPVVLVPKASDVQPSDKANRTLPDVSFSATLAGAVHKVQISGTVSV